MHFFEVNSKSRVIICKTIIFLYAFFIFSRCSTAGISVGACLIIVGILLFRHDWYRIEKRPIDEFWVFYLVFFGALFISAFFSGDLHVISNTWRYFTWTIPFFLFYCMTSIHFEQKMYIYGISAALIVIGGGVFYDMYFHLQIPFSFHILHSRFQGYFAQPNHLATVLAITLPILIMFCYQNRKIKSHKQVYYFALVSSLLGICTLYISGSRGGIVGFILGGLALLLGKYLLQKASQHSLLLFFVILGLLAGSAYGVYHYTKDFQRSYDMERVLLIESSYDMWNDHKLIGVGFERWQDEYPKYILPKAKEPNLPMPHNTLAYFFSTTGLIGGIGFLVYTIGIIIVLLKSISKYPHNLYLQAALWSFIALSIHGMVDIGITNKAAMQIISGLFGVAFASEQYQGEAVLKEK
nr:O-antigen ligase family protein [uncultured Mitsuokella sp.]